MEVTHRKSGVGGQPKKWHTGYEGAGVSGSKTTKKKTSKKTKSMTTTAKQPSL